MKILNVIASMNPSTGGPCQGIRNFIPEFRKLGSLNLVVTLDDPAATFLGKDIIPILPLGPGKGPWCYSKKLLPWLLGNMGNFDVVIVHGLWLYHAFAVRKAFEALKQKKRTGEYKGQLPGVYIMTHGMMDPYFQKDPRRRLKALRNWLYWKWVEGRLVNQASGVLFTCQKELVLAREPFRPYRPKKEFNIGYGIEQPPAFAPVMKDAFLQICPQVKGQNYLLFLSRIHPKKGVHLLLSAYEKLAQQNELATRLPRLVIAGPGLDTAYGKKMQQAVAASKALRERVFFPGMISGNRKWGAFYGCDAFVLASHQENFGIAVAEALACGKPVLISDQVNICEEIRDTEAGLVGTDTVEGCYSILRQWLAFDGKKKSELARQALTLYRNSFEVKSAAKRFIEAVAV